MTETIRRILKSTLVVAAVFLATAGTPVSACPNCKFANETESNRPKAYMYSILFMIGMPATIFTGFGFSFYRMVRKANADAAAQLEAESRAD